MLAVLPGRRHQSARATGVGASTGACDRPGRVECTTSCRRHTGAFRSPAERSSRPDWTIDRGSSPATAMFGPVQHRACTASRLATRRTPASLLDDPENAQLKRKRLDVSLLMRIPSRPLRPIKSQISNIPGFPLSLPTTPARRAWRVFARSFPVTPSCCTSVVSAASSWKRSPTFWSTPTSSVHVLALCSILALRCRHGRRTTIGHNVCGI